MHKPGKRKSLTQKLRPSKSKRTKGYTAHLDAVKSYIDREAVGMIRVHEMIKTLNINQGYLLSCVARLRTQGLKISIAKKGKPHDSYRDGWPGNTGGESGWCSVFLYKRGD